MADNRKFEIEVEFVASGAFDETLEDDPDNVYTSVYDAAEAADALADRWINGYDNGGWFEKEEAGNYLVGPMDENGDKAPADAEIRVVDVAD